MSWNTCLFIFLNTEHVWGDWAPHHGPHVAFMTLNISCVELSWCPVGCKRLSKCKVIYINSDLKFCLNISICQLCREAAARSQLDSRCVVHHCHIITAEKGVQRLLLWDVCNVSDFTTTVAGLLKENLQGFLQDVLLVHVLYASHEDGSSGKATEGLKGIKCITSFLIMRDSGKYNASSVITCTLMSGKAKAGSPDRRSSY